MEKDAVYIQIKELLVSEFQLDVDSISPEKHLYDDLELDSLDLVDMVLRLQEHIEGKVDPGLFKNTRTVQDLVDIVQPIWK